MSDQARVRRHAERVKELVASVVRTQVKDPRMGMMTVTDARLTADLREATVFYTVLGDPVEQAGTAAALESAKGLVRSTVGRALGLRHSPTISFVLDNVHDHATHIDDLLVQARTADAEVQRRAAEAAYAGDPQPYRLPEAGDEAEDDGGQETAVQADPAEDRR